MRVERLNNGLPIIHRGHFVAAGLPEDGDNINGPSIVRLPEWVEPSRRCHPEARFYLYFAHHHGSSIRLAWSSDLLGPWHLHAPGHGVLSLRDAHDVDDADAVHDAHDEPELAIGNGIVLRGHVASPDVHLDPSRRRFVMYFHAPTRLLSGHRLGFEQVSYVALSDDGLHFRIEPVMLGYFYFRVFVVRGRHYAIANKGQLWQAPAGDEPWHAPPGFDFDSLLWNYVGNPLVEALRAEPDNIADHPRHVALRIVNGERLQCLFSSVGDAPERIRFVEIDVADADPARWRACSTIVEVLAPDRPWEGVGRELARSRLGAQTGVQQLRDPCLFHDDSDGGADYLLYCGGGEEAIGLARIELD